MFLLRAFCIVFGLIFSLVVICQLVPFYTPHSNFRDSAVCLLGGNWACAPSFMISLGLLAGLSIAGSLLVVMLFALIQNK
jgi:hypothetical protein